MIGRTAHCELNEQATAFALHALEPEQEIAVLAHLPGCPSCRRAMGDAEVVALGLATSVEQVDPPSHLRLAILAHAGPRPERLLTGAPTTAPPRVRVVRPPAGGSAPPPHRPRTPRTGARRRLAALVIAAAAVVGAATTGYAVHAHQQRDAEVARSQALAGLIASLDAPGTTHATLRTGDGRPVAAVLASATGRTVAFSGLAPNDPADSVYVVWGIGTDAPRALGTVDVSAVEVGVHALGTPDGGPPFVGYAISLEPGRTAPASPTTVVASGQVAV